MKGFLQRLVASARRESAVHPVVGGIYVKEPRRDLIEESALLNVPASRPKYPLPSTAGKQYHADESLDTGEDAAGAPELALMSPKHEFETDAELPAPQRARGAPTEHDRALQTPQVPESAPRPPREDPAEAESETLLPKTRRPPLDPVLPTHSVQAEPARSAALHAGEQARPVGEDIQIHIGRIEVIAVPPPNQRGAPAAAHKSESLSEYLKRKDRRVR
jgi:hypothetical protein